jgi:hypothetical protein
MFYTRMHLIFTLSESELFSRYSKGLWDEQPGFDSLEVQDIFSTLQYSDRLWGLFSLLSNENWRIFFPGVEEHKSKAHLELESRSRTVQLHLYSSWHSA